jgi:nicotinamide riboside transporter PnuC
MKIRNLLAAVLGIACVGQSASNEPTNWQNIAFDTNGIVVTWREKYGAEISDKCVGLWESANQYRLTWRDSRARVIEKSNTNDLQYVINKGE